MSAKTGIIVQARMGSVRLPGKSMMPLAGEPLVGRILERLLRTEASDYIILAIPDNVSNDPLEVLGKQYGVEIFRGSEDDLVDRYYQAARAYNLDIVVRFPADNPVPQPEEIDKIIQHHWASTADFSSNLSEVFNNGYPDGIGAEVFSFKGLEHAWKTDFNPENREHVHLNFFNYRTQMPYNGCMVSTIECPKEFRRPEIILDVNTLDQYKFMFKMYEDLYPKNSKFSIIDIIKWVDSNDKKTIS